MPDELQFRQQRLAKILEAKQRLEKEARDAAEAERRRCRSRRSKSGKGTSKRRGRTAAPISEEPEDKAQTSFTDPELKIMQQNNKGWDYRGNAQMVVDDACQIIVAATYGADQRQATGGANGRESVANLQAAGVAVRVDGRATAEDRRPGGQRLLQREGGVALEAAGLDPYIATERQKHHEAEAAVPLPAGATAKEDGGEVATRRRGGRCTGEGDRGAGVRADQGGARIRRFSCCGDWRRSGEWRLVCLTHNLLKIWRWATPPSVN